MKITVITIFPDFFTSPLEISIVKRALESAVLEVDVRDLRDHATGVHRSVDDAPFGGGAGMVMMVEPLDKALAPLAETHRILFAPTGRPLRQAMLDRWANEPHLTLVCGRYEGVDERVAVPLIVEEVSLGDFVLAGGEAAALAVIEGVARLLPGVLGNPESIRSESFRGSLLEEPQYTRPAEYRGWKVPEVLLSGDHAKVAAWREEQRRERTRLRRPDLLDNHDA